MDLEQINYKNRVKLPTVTLVVSNNGDYDNLVDSIESVIEQDYPLKSAIIVNTNDKGDEEKIANKYNFEISPLNASNNSQDVCSSVKYKEISLMVYSTKKYLLETQVRDRGISLSKDYTHIWGFMQSSDEYLTRDIVSKIVQNFINVPNIGIIHPNYYLDKDEILRPQVETLHNHFYISQAMLRRENDIVVSPPDFNSGSPVHLPYPFIGSRLSDLSFTRIIVSPSLKHKHKFGQHKRREHRACEI